jgi:hypothetical protein
MIAKRQTTLLMCGLTVIALILMSSSNQPTTNRRELQHVLARGLLEKEILVVTVMISVFITMTEVSAIIKLAEPAVAIRGYDCRNLRFEAPLESLKIGR